MVYAHPKEIVLPEYDPKDGYKAHEKKEEKFVEELREWCKKNSKDKEAGETIGLPVADGSAIYMVFSVSPPKLIHVPIGDAYSMQYADRLTAADIRKELKYAKARGKLFFRD